MTVLRDDVIISQSHFLHELEPYIKPIEEVEVDHDQVVINGWGWHQVTIDLV